MPNGEIDSDFFDPDQLTSERMLGQIIASQIREGTIGKLAGETIWYFEVENISREMTFNFSKELLPAKGPNALWTLMLLAFKNIGISITRSEIPKLKGRYFWFNVHDITYKDKEGKEKTSTRNFCEPVGIPTQEEIQKALAKRGLAPVEGESKDDSVPWKGDDEPTEKASEEEKKDSPPARKLPENAAALVLSLIDGNTHEQFMEQVKEFAELLPYMGVLQDKTGIAELIVDKKLGLKDGKYFTK